MFVKVVGCLLFVAFCFVQFGSSLDCWNCNTPDSCKSPSRITCNRVVANATNDHLHTYFTQNLTSAVSDNFDCFRHNYSTPVQSISNVTYFGCVYRAVNVCGLSLKPEYNSLQKKDCVKCSGDMCNRSPAGTFSSSAVTLLASVLAVSIYKVLSM